MTKAQEDFITFIEGHGIGKVFIDIDDVRYCSEVMACEDCAVYKSGAYCDELPPEEYNELKVTHPEYFI